MEAYYEVINRAAHSGMSPERAMDLTRLTNLDATVEDMEHAANAVKFATTPYN